MPAPGQRLERTVSRELSEELLRDCLDIVHALDPPADLRLAVFQAASAHAGQLTIVASDVEIPGRLHPFRSQD